MSRPGSSLPDILRALTPLARQWRTRWDRRKEEEAALALAEAEAEWAREYPSLYVEHKDDPERLRTAGEELSQTIGDRYLRSRGHDTGFARFETKTHATIGEAFVDGMAEQEDAQARQAAQSVLTQWHRTANAVSTAMHGRGDPDPDRSVAAAKRLDVEMASLVELSDQLVDTRLAGHITLEQETKLRSGFADTWIYNGAERYGEAWLDTLEDGVRNGSYTLDGTKGGPTLTQVTGLSRDEVGDRIRTVRNERHQRAEQVRAARERQHALQERQRAAESFALIDGYRKGELPSASATMDVAIEKGLVTTPEERNAFRQRLQERDLPLTVSRTVAARNYSELHYALSEAEARGDVEAVREVEERIWLGIEDRHLTSEDGEALRKLAVEIKRSIETDPLEVKRYKRMTERVAKEERGRLRTVSGTTVFTAGFEKNVTVAYEQRRLAEFDVGVGRMYQFVLNVYGHDAPEANYRLAVGLLGDEIRLQTHPDRLEGMEGTASDRAGDAAAAAMLRVTDPFFLKHALDGSLTNGQWLSVVDRNLYDKLDENGLVGEDWRIDPGRVWEYATGVRGPHREGGGGIALWRRFQTRMNRRRIFLGLHPHSPLGVHPPKQREL